jgi:hypothetical protein
MRRSARDCDARRVCAQRGATEMLGLVMMTPVVMAAAFGLLWISRQVDTQAQLHTAVEAAAQAAALQRSPYAAQEAAESMAAEMLNHAEGCQPTRVQVDLSAFGPGGKVTVAIDCEVSVSGLQWVSGRGARFSARSTVGLDRFKQIDASMGGR